MPAVDVLGPMSYGRLDMAIEAVVVVAKTLERTIAIVVDDAFGWIVKVLSSQLKEVCKIFLVEVVEASIAIEEATETMAIASSEATMETMPPGLKV